jgi:hypothetical protein
MRRENAEARQPLFEIHTPSWPGLTRPSRVSGAAGLDARVKPANEGEKEMQQGDSNPSETFAA